jgi:hypothetical protein
VQIGAILTTSGDKKETDSSELDARHVGTRVGPLTEIPVNKLQVVGNNLLELAMRKLRDAGINSPLMVSEGFPRSSKLSRQLSGRAFAWERAVSECLAKQMDALFLLGVREYTDLDYNELLRFHLERGSVFTQVYDETGPLDIAIINCAALRNGNGTYHAILDHLVPQQGRFYYEGYVNRLRKPLELMQLIEDALHGRCNLLPVGTEVAAGIWVGAGAEVDDSCTVSGPVFIGAETRIGAGCTIGGNSAIEQACKIDTGTTIENSWILQNTYIGVGLNVRRTIVSNRKIFHLDRRTEVAINDRRLIGAIRQLSLGESVAKFGRFQLNKSTD